MKKLFLVILVMIVCAPAYGQYRDNINKKLGDYTFKSFFDTTNYETTFTILDIKGKKIYEIVYLDFISDVNEHQFEKNGNKYITIDLYSGGAHCCSALQICEIKNNKFRILDSAFYGNSGYIIEDLDKDGVKEILSGNDMFAYAFTNYAETRFPLRVQEFKNDKLNDITGRFKTDLIAEIGYFEADLEEFLKENPDYMCPDTEGEDTFNTDAGSMKIMLAAIVADYYSLGEVERGYELVDKYYKCNDKDKFIKILKTDFNLK
jgi:hypothetical protein